MTHPIWLSVSFELLEQIHSNFSISLSEKIGESSRVVFESFQGNLLKAYIAYR